VDSEMGQQPPLAPQKKYAPYSLIDHGTKHGFQARTMTPSAPFGRSTNLLLYGPRIAGLPVFAWSDR
jgi:hypothetical protein